MIPLLLTSGLQECALTGIALLQTPYLNKGTAFTKEERKAFGISGLLPAQVSTLEEQMQRAYEQYHTHRTSLGKNVFLTSLKDQNEVLYYRILQDHLKEIFPIIYTPTEGEAIARYSRLFRRPEGCFLNIAEPGAIENALDGWGSPEDVDIIVCSDSEQILGTHAPNSMSESHTNSSAFRLQVSETRALGEFSSALQS